MNAVPPGLGGPGARGSGTKPAPILAAAALLFAVLAVAMTWPLATRMSTAVADHGDPLLNSWILAWNAHRLAGPASGGWFDANIFHPHRRTLAWSEHLLPQSLLVAPVLWAGGGPVLAHNLLLLLAFASNGLGMFLLARHHTGAFPPAFFAGMVFAFCPFMFGHIWHLQVLCAAGIPLSFLLLERLFRSAGWRDTLLLAGVLTAQVLANGYYAVFLSLFVPLFVSLELTRLRLWTSKPLWLRLAVAAAIVAGLSAPLFLQYAAMREETGFARSPLAFTDGSALLAVHPLNRLWGPLTSHLGAGERYLFPGLTALALAALGAFRGRGGPGPRSTGPSTVTYLALGAAALLLSFGSGSYGVVRAVLPGFDAIRAPSRMHVFVMLSIALLAAHGATFLGLRRPAVSRLLYLVIPLGLLAEYATVPIPWAHVFARTDVPSVYRWIDRHTAHDDVLLELPIPTGYPARPYAECRRLYASTFHWRRLVNGYSGIEPPLYVELIRRWDRLEPLDENLRDASGLGVRWVVVHTNMPGGAELAASLDAVPERIRPAAGFEDARVYELPPAAAGAGGGELVPLAQNRLRVKASVNGDRAHLAVDGDPRTRWDSGVQRPGTHLEIDLGAVAPVCAVRLRYGPSHDDWPRGLRVEASADDLGWTVLDDHPSWRPPLVAWLDPRSATAEVRFSPTRTRGLRLVQTARHDDHFWSIHELEVLGGEACANASGFRPSPGRP